MEQVHWLGRVVPVSCSTKGACAGEVPFHIGSMMTWASWTSTASLIFLE